MIKLLSTCEQFLYAVYHAHCLRTNLIAIPTVFLLVTVLTSSATAGISPCRRIYGKDFKVYGVPATLREESKVELQFNEAKSTLNYDTYGGMSIKNRRGRAINFGVYSSPELKDLNIHSDISDTEDGRYFVINVITAHGGTMQDPNTNVYYYVEDNGASCETPWVIGLKPMKIYAVELDLHIPWKK